jgi:flagellar basal body-associated protein FliL
MVFNANLNSSYDSRRKKTKTRLFLLIVVGLMVAAYFLVPKFFKFNSEEKTAQTANNVGSEAAPTSQIVKEIELPKLEEIQQ